MITMIFIFLLPMMYAVHGDKVSIHINMNLNASKNQVANESDICPSHTSPPGLWIASGVPGAPTCADFGAVPMNISGSGGQCYTFCKLQLEQKTRFFAWFWQALVNIFQQVNPDPDPTPAPPTTIVPTTPVATTQKITTFAAPEDVNWSTIKNACIKGNNFKVHQPVTIEVCKEKCIEEVAIKCNSIEYSASLQMCSVSEARSDSEDYIEPCTSDGWVFAEKELITVPTTSADTTPAHTTIKSTIEDLICVLEESKTHNSLTSPFLRGSAAALDSDFDSNIDSDSRAGPTRNGGCNIQWKDTYDGYQPLIYKVTFSPQHGSVYDNSVTEFKDQEELFLACAGPDNKFESFIPTIIKIKCEGDTIHSTIDKQQKPGAAKQCKIVKNVKTLQTFRCKEKNELSIARYEDSGLPAFETCGKVVNNNPVGDIHIIGYHIYQKGARQAIPVIKICFDKNKQTTLWTEHTIDGKNYGWRKGISEDEEPDFRVGLTASPWNFHKYQLDKNIYNSGEQEDYFTKKQFKATIDYDNNYYLARGHMAAKGDFVEKEEQKATYYYLNALPQWQVINNGNWARIEHYIRELSVCLRRKLKIYSGGLNVLYDKAFLGDIVTDPKVKKDETVPIPAITWKVVFDEDSNRAVVFVVQNNPYIKKNEIPAYQDKSKCSELDWLYMHQDKLKEIEKGYTACLKLKDFKNIDPIEIILPSILGPDFDLLTG